MANREKITVTSIDVEDTEISYKVLMSGKDKFGMERWGAHEEFKAKGGKDTHAYAKAVSKCQRNLFKAFLYGHEIIVEAFEKWEASEGKQQPTPRAQATATRPAKTQQQPQQQKPVEQPAQETEMDKVQQEAFKLYESHEASLSMHGVTKAIFWTKAVPAMYGVKGRDDMTESNWKNVTASLQLAEKKSVDGSTTIIDANKYPAWISDHFESDEDEKDAGDTEPDAEATTEESTEEVSQETTEETAEPVSAEASEQVSVDGDQEDIPF